MLWSGTLFAKEVGVSLPKAARRRAFTGLTEVSGGPNPTGTIPGSLRDADCARPPPSRTLFVCICFVKGERNEVATFPAGSAGTGLWLVDVPRLCVSTG